MHPSGAEHQHHDLFVQRAFLPKERGDQPLFDCRAHPRTLCFGKLIRTGGAVGNQLSDGSKGVLIQGFTRVISFHQLQNCPLDGIRKGKGMQSGGTQRLVQPLNVLGTIEEYC